MLLFPAACASPFYLDLVWEIQIIKLSYLPLSLQLYIHCRISFCLSIVWLALILGESFKLFIPLKSKKSDLEFSQLQSVSQFGFVSISRSWEKRKKCPNRIKQMIYLVSFPLLEEVQCWVLWKKMKIPLPHPPAPPNTLTVWPCI